MPAGEHIQGLTEGLRLCSLANKLPSVPQNGDVIWLIVLLRIDK